jgi:hypothetical protein
MRGDAVPGKLGAAAGSIPLNEPSRRPASPSRRELLSLQEMRGRNDRSRAGDANAEQNHEPRIELGARHHGCAPVRRRSDRFMRERLVLRGSAAHAGKRYDIVGKRAAMVLEIHRRGLLKQSHQVGALMTRFRWRMKLRDRSMAIDIGRRA